MCVRASNVTCFNGFVPVVLGKRSITSHQFLTYTLAVRLCALLGRLIG